MKARGDAKLKTLPEERQAAVAEHALGHKLSETVEWLRSDGVSSSQRAVSEFLSWYRLKAQLSEDESTTETLLEELKRDVPGLTEEQLDDLGQRTFSLLAIRRQDLGGFVKVRSARTRAQLEGEKLRLKEVAEKRMQEALGLEKARFQRETAALFLKWAEDERAKAIAGGATSNAEKIEQLGELMFGEDWK